MTTARKHGRPKSGRPRSKQVHFGARVPGAIGVSRQGVEYGESDEERRGAASPRSGDAGDSAYPVAVKTEGVCHERVCILLQITRVTVVRLLPVLACRQGLSSANSR